VFAPVVAFRAAIDSSHRRATLKVVLARRRFVQSTCIAKRDGAPIHPDYARLVTLSGEGVERLREKSRKRQGQFLDVGPMNCSLGIARNRTKSRTGS